jgi:hypothetical protein
VEKFKRVKQILDNAVNNQNFAAHGPFWRNLSRDQFVARRVFGQQLLIVGNGNDSNLVKALKGESPFGSDIGTSGAIFRRMPAGRPQVAQEDIEFIRQWIDDGCPDDQPEEAVFDLTAGGPIDPTLHNSYWRDLDNWAMFQVTQPVSEAINTFFAVAPMWMAFAKDNSREVAWSNAITQAGVKGALTLLSGRQVKTVQDHYGKSIPLLTVLDSYEQFGAGILPPDTLRPEDPNHNMNGPEMWFFWSSFADACLRSGVDKQFWKGLIRAILLGMMNDGVFRGRFHVTGFTPDDAGKEAMRVHVRSLDDAGLQPELIRRFVDSGLG